MVSKTHLFIKNSSLSLHKLCQCKETKIFLMNKCVFDTIFSSNILFMALKFIYIYIYIYINIKE